MTRTRKERMCAAARVFNNEMKMFWQGSERLMPEHPFMSYMTDTDGKMLAQLTMAGAAHLDGLLQDEEDKDREQAA